MHAPAERGGSRPWSLTGSRQTEAIRPRACTSNETSRVRGGESGRSTSNTAFERISRLLGITVVTPRRQAPQPRREAHDHGAEYRRRRWSRGPHRYWFLARPTSWKAASGTTAERPEERQTLCPGHASFRCAECRAPRSQNRQRRRAQARALLRRHKGQGHWLIRRRTNHRKG